MQRIPIYETPFNLTFRIEAMILLELGFPSLQVESFNEDSNSKYLRVNLDLLEEVQERATLRMETYL